MTPREIEGLLRMVEDDCPDEHGLPRVPPCNGRCLQCWIAAWELPHADGVDEAAKRITEEAGRGAED